MTSPLLKSAETRTLPTQWSETLEAGSLSVAFAGLISPGIAEAANSQITICPFTGINWDSSHYVDGRIDISNPTDYDYRDVDLLSSSDITIFGAGQITDIPGVSFFAERSHAPISAAWLNRTDSSGKPVTIPLPRPLDLSKPTGLKLVCDKFPKRSTFQIVSNIGSMGYKELVPLKETEKETNETN